MTQSVVDAKLEVFEPGNTSTDSPDTTVQAGKIKNATITERLQDEVDQAEFRLEDNDASLAGLIDSGDRIRWYRRLSSQDNSDYGDGDYGDGTYSGEIIRGWTGLVRTPIPEQRGGGKQDLIVQADDFVFGVMGIRTVTNGFEGDDISGGTNAILNTILRNNASEIDRSQIVDVGGTASVSWSSKKLLECVRELADRGNALVTHQDTSLVFKRLTSPSVTASLANSDHGIIRAPKNDDRLMNEVTVEGGEDTNVDDQQNTQSSTQTVTDSNRLTTQLDVSKSEVALAEIYTKTTGSGDNVVVRIHPDDGNGNPLDVNSREQDFAKRNLASEFLADDGFTTFLLPDHTFGPKFDPHLIVESDGTTGQDIGTDGSGTPTYKAHYPFRLATIVSDQSSISTYRRREASLRAPDADTKAQTEQRGDAALRHRNKPEREVQFPAESARAHDWQLGDVIQVDKTDLNASGEYMITSRAREFDGTRNELSTNIVAQDVVTI